MTAPQTDREHGVAPRIREARRGAGLSQEGLAALVGVTVKTVRSWEAGRTAPGREHLAAIAFHCRTAGAGVASGERSLPVMLSRDERMRAVLGAVGRHKAEHGYPPSMQELMDETGFSSLSVVKYSLDWCEEAGLIVRARGIARGITLTEAGRAFAEAPGESGPQPVARPEDPAPGAADSLEAADVAADADPAARRNGRTTPARRGAYASASRRSEPASAVAAHIREARLGAGLTQRELAALVGVAPHTVWAWEAGRMKPTWEHRTEVASHCGTDVGALEGRTGPDRERLQAAAATFRDAVAHLPERDIKLIWTFIGFLRWKRRRRARAA